MEARGIAHRFSAPYTPQQNGKAERMIGTLKGTMLAMLHAAGLKSDLWQEAMFTASFLRNVQPGPRGALTPWQLFRGTRPDVSWLKVFGSRAFVRVPTDLRRGIEPISNVGIFLGYTQDSIQYRVLVEDAGFRKVTQAAPQHVVVDESWVHRVPSKGGNEQPQRAVAGEQRRSAAAGGMGGAAPLAPAPQPNSAPSAAATRGTSAAASAASVPVQIPIPVPAAPISLKERMQQLFGAAGALPAAAPAAQQQPNVAELKQRLRATVARFGPAPTGGGAPVIIAPGSDSDEEDFPAPHSVTHSQPSALPTASASGAAAGAGGSGHVSAGSSGFGDARSQGNSGSGSDSDGGTAGTGGTAATTASGRPVRAAAVASRAALTKLRQQYSLAALADQPDPATLKQALSRPDADQWRAAIQAEFASLQQHGTWELVDAATLPAGTRLIDSKWVFKTKRKDGVVVKHKARLVARGFMQQHGIDYEEVYAPTSKHTTLRAVLALAAAHKLVLRQCDFVTAFLNGNLEETVYMQQPPGFEAGSSNQVCRLRKALYGLKQAPRAWHTRLRAELLALGFTSSQADASLFWRREADGQLTLLLCYVDDCLIAGTGSHPDQVITQLASRFDLTDLGDPSVFVGVQIQRDIKAGTISISQERMAHELVEKYGLGECKPKATPLSVAVKLSKEDGDLLDAAAAREYRELVGSLLYLTCCTRPDLAQAVGALTRYTAAPTSAHWTAAKGVLRYLASTAPLGITFGRSSSSPSDVLIGYADANYGGDIDTRRSTTGYAFILFGGVVSWSSRLQHTVAVSTAEAEYMAAAGAVKEALWLKTLLRDIGLQVPAPLIIYGDNQAAIKLLKHPIASARSKHIDIIYHFARERVAAGEIEFVYISTSLMVADCLTKALPEAAFKACVKGFGMS